MILAGCAALLATSPFPLTDADAYMYAKAAKNILASGDWLTLRHPVHAMDVPPLTIWLMAASLRIGGDTASALRLWHILMTLLLVAVTYRLARRGTGPEASALAALLMVTNQQVFLWSLGPKQDIPVTLFLTLALYGYLRFRQGGGAWVGAEIGLWVALAVLTKGPAALGGFALIVGGELLLAGRQSGSAQRTGPAHGRWVQIAAGAAVFLAVAAPWFVHGTVRGGAAFAEIFFLQRSTAWRFVKGYGPTLPYWAGLLAYVPMTVVGFLPWSGLLPGAVREGWRRIRDPGGVLRLCAVWALVIFLILSLVPGTKSIRYLLPLYPPLAILSARYLAAVMDTPRGLWPSAVITGAILIPPAVAVVGFGIGRDSPEIRGFVPAIALLGLVAAGFVLAARRHARLAVSILAGGMIIVNGTLAWTTTQAFNRQWPWESVAAQIDSRAQPGDQVLIVGQANLESNFLNYYLKGPVMLEADLGAFRQAWRQVGVIALLAPAAYRVVEAEVPRRSIVITLPSGWVLVSNRGGPRGD